MREHGVAEAGAPRDELAALVVQLDGVDDEAGVEPDGDARGGVGRDDRRAEQQVAEVDSVSCSAATRVDDGLRQAERVALGDVDDAGAVAAERGGRGRRTASPSTSACTGSERAAPRRAASSIRPSEPFE